VQVSLSRHAKRRTRLYGIPEQKIIEIVNTKELAQGLHEIVERISGIVYPVKIVVLIKGNSGIVITSYPLKKGRSR
jgi:hypothetical protein